MITITRTIFGLYAQWAYTQRTKHFEELGDFLLAVESSHGFEDLKAKALEIKRFVPTNHLWICLADAKTRHNRKKVSAKKHTL